MVVLWFSNSPAAAYSDTHQGTGGWVFVLDRALHDKVELHVAYLFPYKQAAFVKDGTWYHPIYSGNIIIESLKRRLFPGYQKEFLEDYLKIIDVVNPDIIHIHGSENSFLDMANRTTVPIVLSIQGNPTVIAYKYNSGLYGKFINTKIGQLSLKSLLLGRRSFSKDLNNIRQMSINEQTRLPYIKYVIGRTDWDRRVLGVLSPNSRYYVVNEAMRNVFYNHSWHMSAPIKKLIIHTTIADVYYKGFETICYSLSILNKLGLNVEWRVAGISSCSSINRITKKILGSNYPQKGLLLLGVMNEKDLLGSLLNSHLYVMPSHIENSPNSLCEAMLLGMPCITTLAGGSDSILTNKVDGLVIQDGDPWSMAGAIKEMIHNWETALAYGKQAREHALRRHDKNCIVNDLLSTYQKIINESTINRIIL